MMLRSFEEGSLSGTRLLPWKMVLLEKRASCTLLELAMTWIPKPPSMTATRRTSWVGAVLVRRSGTRTTLLRPAPAIRHAYEVALEARFAMLRANIIASEKRLKQR